MGAKMIIKLSEIQRVDKDISLIDFGGTPEKIMESNPVEILLKKADNYQMIAILDPFDLSRAQRRFVLSKKCPRIKFSVGNINSEKYSADKFKVCIEEAKQSLELAENYVLNLFPGFKGKDIARVYSEFRQEAINIAKNSLSLRDFMNSLFKYLLPAEIKTERMEDILSKNKDKIYSLLEKYPINVRAFCPECGKTEWTNINKDNLEELVCCIPKRRLIETGSYIPEGKFLRLIVALGGITSLIDSECDYLNEAIDLLDKNFKSYNVLIKDKYSESTMFESYMLRKLGELK